METNITYEYPQGIWCIDEDNPKFALRITGNKTLRVPITTEILEEIKKQTEPLNLFRAFMKMNPEDINNIGYLITILEACVNRLDLASQKYLTIKIQQLEQSPNIDPINAELMQKIRKNLEERIYLDANAQDKADNLYIFYDITEQLKMYNKAYLSTAINNSSTTTKTR